MRSEQIASAAAANSNGAARSAGTRIITGLLNNFGAFQQCGRVFDAHTSAGGHPHHAVLHCDRRVEPGTSLLHPEFVLLVLADILDDAREMEHVDEAEAAGDMDGGRHFG